MDIKMRISALESLLFVSGEPLSLVRLTKIMRVSQEELGEAVRELSEKYTSDIERGLMLVENNNQVVLATKRENAALIEDLTKSVLQENLSKAALEVLSIISYRAPITRSQIEAVRGVNCSFTLRNLMLRDLIVREGKATDARGYVYQPSVRFLQVLGLQKKEELPDFKTLSEDDRLKIVLEEETLENTLSEAENKE